LAATLPLPRHLHDLHNHNPVDKTG